MVGRSEQLASVAGIGSFQLVRSILHSASKSTAASSKLSACRACNDAEQMTPQLPSVLSTTDLPLAELLAARLDGELFALDRGFAPVDLPDTALRRAESLGVGLNPRLIAEQHTAAWVWGALNTPPSLHEFCTALDARIAHRAARWMSVREVVIDHEDVAEVGPLRLTTPLRTCIDLARFSNTFGDREIAAVRSLMARGDFAIGECLRLLDRRRNLPGKRLATQRLARVDAVNVVHRIDPSHGVQDPVKMGRVTHLKDVTTERKALARR